MKNEFRKQRFFINNSLTFVDEFFRIFAQYFEKFINDKQTL